MSTYTPGLDALAAASRRRAILPERMPKAADTPLPPRRLVDSLDWDEAMAYYRMHVEARNLRDKTWVNYAQELGHLSRHVGVPPARVTRGQLLAWVGRPIAASSKQRTRSIIQQFFRWLYDEGYALEDPAARLPKVRVPAAAPRPLSVEQVEQVIASCRTRTTRTMVIFGVHGFRVGEIAALRGEQIDLSSNTITYTAKGGVRRTAELSPMLRAEVAHYPRYGYWFPGQRGNDGGHMSSKSVSDTIGRAIRRAGIQDRTLTAHSLRHTFGTELMAAGVDIRVIAETMGHASIQSTLRYTKVPQQQVREAIAKLPEFTLPGAHFSRAHRRAWLNLMGAAQLLGVTEAETARLARAHGWRYTAEQGALVYAISDVEATLRGMQPG